MVSADEKIVKTSNRNKTKKKQGSVDKFLFKNPYNFSHEHLETKILTQKGPGTVPG